jgi:pimeloyl-ACP methyl ester carboxylesterase
MAQFVTLSTGIRMEYVEQGPADGLPVVFHHGVTDSWRSFERVLPLLPSEVRAFAVSARGHGDSSRPDRGYLISDMSRDLQAFMDAMGLDTAVVVGHSMGAMVTQRFVADHPERVRGFVLMGAFATLFQDPVVAGFYDSAIASLVDPIDAAFAREWQESTLARPMPADHLETVVNETLKVPARVWREAFQGFLSTPDFTGELTRVTAPCLIAWGDKDSYALRESQDRLAAAIPGSRLVIYEGGGHAFHWEDPARFATDLSAFLSSVASPVSP